MDRALSSPREASLEAVQGSALAALFLCVMFCLPFVLVGVSYGALPSKLPVIRLFLGHVVLWAPKSLFMVFRVPLMNLIHGLMALVMLSREKDFGSRERRTSYSYIFSTLLFTIGLKSNLEALAFVAVADPALLPDARWIGPGTLMTVVIGLALAATRGRRVPLPWPELRLTKRDKVVLSGLFAGYITILIASLLGSYRG